MQDYKRFFEGKTIVVTGGAGSIGSALVKRLLKFKPKSIRVLDIDEYGLFKLKQEIRVETVRCLIGDIRDRERVELALRGADIVVHCAALKHVDINEYNPDEAIRTNVLGTLNVLKVAVEEKSIKKVVLTGSDKAVYPVSLYGTTKLLAELLFKWADNITPKNKVFCIARFCNVIESRGNVFEVWKKQMENGKPLTITDKHAIRYFMQIDDAVELIISCIVFGKGKEVFIPRKCVKLNIADLAAEKAIKAGLSKKMVRVGLRPGEKLVEELVTFQERKSTINRGNFAIIKYR